MHRRFPQRRARLVRAGVTRARTGVATTGAHRRVGIRIGIDRGHGIGIGAVIGLGSLVHRDGQDGVALAIGDLDVDRASSSKTVPSAGSKVKSALVSSPYATCSMSPLL